MIQVIPYPKKVNMDEAAARVLVPATVNMAAFPKAALTLKDYVLRTYGIHAVISPKGAVTFVADATMGEDAYTLAVEAGKVTVTAATSRGAQNAVSTLVQLMEKADAQTFALPAGSIEDDGDSTWRGTMIDLARDWHELHVLYEYVDMCRFFKLKYLHLHFTDDQSYTLPSKAFPKISTPGRHYTEGELKALLEYAKSRDVEIIPEIDVPGHCTSFAQGYGEIFGTNGIIRQTEESMTAMEALFTELCELFADSSYIHIGGDEADIDKWTEDEGTVAAFRAAGVDVDGMEKHDLAQYMYASFLVRMCKAVMACDKTPVIWEGFAESMNHMIPREAVVMSWENFYQPTPSLQKAGFRLVNCSWSPLYVVTPVAHWTPEEIYNWSVNKWYPTHPNSPYKGTVLEIEPAEQIEGAQLLAWGDHIEKQYAVIAEGVRAEQAFIEEDCPCLSENLWNRVKVSDWAEFSARKKLVDAKYAAFRAGK